MYANYVQAIQPSRYQTLIRYTTRLQVYPCFIEASAIVWGSLSTFGYSNGRWLSAASQHTPYAGVVSHLVETYGLRRLQKGP